MSNDWLPLSAVLGGGGSTGDSAGSAGCPKCGMMGCNCQLPKEPTRSTICLVCKRHLGLCICVSQGPVRETHDFGGFKAHPCRPYSDRHLDRLTNEAMGFYYNRDAQGLIRWLRRELA